MKLNDLRPLQKKTFTGTYRLTGRVTCFDDDGFPYSKLRLSSCTDDIVVLAAINGMTIPERLSHMELVVVKGHVCIGVEESAILLTDIRRPLRTDVARLPALQTLPRTFCPQPEHLDQLIESVRALETEHLQVFIKRVLERRDRLEVFLKAPASKCYHHNGPGGLLVHSLEVAKGVLNMIRINKPDMPRALQEVGFVAGLLHDIGKTFTCDVKGRPTAAARLCAHDDLTLARISHEEGSMRKEEAA